MVDVMMQQGRATLAEMDKQRGILKGAQRKVGLRTPSPARALALPAAIAISSMRGCTPGRLAL
jgi:hypothetical protein